MCFWAPSVSTASTGVCASGLRNEISAATTARGFFLVKRDLDAYDFLKRDFSLFVLEHFVRKGVKGYQMKRLNVYLFW